MADLLSIAELAWRQLFPPGSDESKVRKEQFIADAKTEYARQVWIQIMNQRQMDGDYDVPSHLLGEAELEVVDGNMDISSLKIMRGLPFETWLQNVGGLNCECRYIKTTLNLAQVLCDDDSISDNDKTYYAKGKSIRFPRGVHKSPLEITYAKAGELLDESIEVEDAIGGEVRRALVELYGGKVGKEDVTNNSNSDQ